MVGSPCRHLAGAGGWELSRTTGENCVVAAFQSKSGGVVLVAGRLMQVHEGSVIAVRTESVRPTVEHFSTFDGAATCSQRWGRGRRCDGGCSTGGQASARSGSPHDAASAVDASIAGREATNAFLVAELKLGLKQ
jgi:hypothetical protein